MRLIRNQSGDTMIEVLASIAIVGLALAGGYALSSHSLRTGMDAGQRSEALSLAQGQVEFLKNSVFKGQSSLYTGVTGSFCIDDANGTPRTGAFCSSLSGRPFSMSIIYNSTTRVFTVEPRWTSFRSTDPNKLTLYYKLPDTYSP